MPSNPQELTGRAFAGRLAVFYAALFVTLGVQMPFLPVWLAAKGLDAQTIGFVLALPMVVRLFAIPMATRFADRHDATRAVIVAGAAAATVGFGALGFAQGAVAIAALYVLASAASMPLFTLADVYALRGLASWRQAYGRVRLWGSAAFIVATLGAGLLLDVIPASGLIWLIVVAAALCAAAAFALPGLSPRLAATDAPRAAATAMLRDPGFIAVVAAASLIQASHALYYGFSTIDWQAAGFDGGTIGALWALGVLAEIVLFALSARLPVAVTPAVLLLIGAAGAVLRWGAMALNPPAAALPFLQCLHALSFGATHLGALTYLARAAPAGLAATAQGYLSIGLGLAMAGATGLAGLLYGHYGAASYGAMAMIAAAGLVAALAALRVRHAGEG